MDRVTFIDNCKVENKYIELINLLDKHVWSWDTQKEYFMRARSSRTGEKETIEDELLDWKLEDTAENRQRVLDYWRTDYIEWFEIYEDSTIRFGQGDYTISTSLTNVELEEINILGYEPVCTHRLKITGEFVWED